MTAPRLFESPPESDSLADRQLPPGAPLASRARPRSLAELVGQEQLLAPGSALRSAIEAGRPHSMILHGPPGTGKTSLARIIGATPGFSYEERSAVQVGLAEVRAVIERARERLVSAPLRSAGAGPAATGTIFFLDEIHRFNRSQQDALLPAIEEGLLVLIGATTQNPAYEINAALLSRVSVYALKPISAADIESILRRACSLAEPPVAPADEALSAIAQMCDGDARSALGILELALDRARDRGAERLLLEHVVSASSQRTVRYDRSGDEHYDHASAWIKATRGGDPDASIYYLAVMLEGGEDPRFIARRMVILASEDIGNADPGALPLALAAASAVERLGMPEAHYALAQAAIYLALAPKSNAAGAALSDARGHVREHGAAAVPPWLRSGTRLEGDATGASEPYIHPHGLPGSVSGQELLPAELQGRRFFRPGESETHLALRLAELRDLALKQRP